MSKHRNRRAARIVAFGAAGALTVAAGVTAVASASQPATATATTCSFTRSGTSASTGDNPRHVVTGDLDGDGNADVVAADNSAGSVSVLLGNGDGTFGAATDYSVGDAPYQTVIADFDADGNPVGVYTGIAGGSLSELTELPADGAYAAAAADVTSDGTTDLVVASSSDDAVDVFTGSCS